MPRRAKTDTDERYSAFIRIQLKPIERALIDAQAASVGLQPSPYARRLLLNGPIPKAGRDAQAIRDLAVALDRFAVAIDRVVSDLDAIADIAKREGRLPSFWKLRAWAKEFKTMLPDEDRKDLLKKVFEI